MALPEKLMQSLVSTTKVVCAIRSSKAGGAWAGERGGAGIIYFGSQEAGNTENTGVGSVWVLTGGVME